MRERVAVVMNEEYVRRLTLALTPFVRRQFDFKVINIQRSWSELERLLRQLKPEGLILEWLPETADRLMKLGLPTVITNTEEMYPNAMSVDVDNREVGREVGRAFQQIGLKSFACLSNGLPYAQRRLEGFSEIVGRTVPVFIEEDYRESHYSEDFLTPTDDMLEWLHRLPKPVGIFAVHDPLGRFLCSSCEQAGLSIPEQVAVIAANNDELVCGMSTPTLSSVAIPWDRVGAQVGEAMVRLLRGERPSEAILLPPGSVVMRHSADHLAVEDPELRRAMSYFSERIQEPISVGIMCGDLRLPRRSIERKFREIYRCSPWDMLCRMRVNRARDLLVTTRYPVSMVAELCGFNDPERMAVVFRRITGQTPSAYRRAHPAG